MTQLISRWILCCTPSDTGEGVHSKNTIKSKKLRCSLFISSIVRICAGKNYAEAMAFTAMARLLATFDISMAKDSQGKDIVPELQFKSSVVR